jgi:toxin FitB
MFLLDTNVVSELRKARSGQADDNVVKWASGVDVNLLYLSVVTIHEIEIGTLRIERRDPVQGKLYRFWLEQDILPVFAGRILPIDLQVAHISAKSHVPDPASPLDAFIAATALVHGFTVVTRNVADFEPTGVLLLNPWQEQARQP